VFLISDTQKRVPRFIYKELLKGTHKTVARILELEGQPEHRERETNNIFANLHQVPIIG
jgi:hypothetical protein